MVVRHDDPGLDNRLFDMVDELGVGEPGGVIDHQLLGLFAPAGDHFIDYRRHGGDQVLPVFPLQPLQGDIHMQHAQEAQAVAVAQGGRGFFLINNRGIVELEFLQGYRQLGIIIGADGIDAAEDHRQDPPETGNGRSFRMIRRDDGITDMDIAHLPDDGAQIAHLSGAQFFAWAPARE